MSGKSNFSNIRSLSGYIDPVTIIYTDGQQPIRLYKDTSNNSVIDLDYSNLISTLSAKAAMPNAPNSSGYINTITN